MSIFWTLFWSGFIGFPLLVLFATLFRSKDSGSEIDRSHIWVRPTSRAKVKDASVRDVWEHNHPGKTWADHQESQFIGVAIFLGLVFLWFMYWLAGKVFILPQDNTALRLFWQIGGPILGGLTAGLFILIESTIPDMKTDFFRVLNIIALVVLGLGVIGALIFAYLKKPLPISPNWLWAVMGLALLFLIMDAIAAGGKKKRASKGGGNMAAWVHEMTEKLHRRDWSLILDKNNTHRNAMYVTQVMLVQGELDYSLKDEAFFKRTEKLMLDLINGRSMSLSDDQMYNASREISETLQKVYFYSVDKLDFDMHPRIKAALTKKK